MPEGSASLQLAVGDRVVYPNQGVCRVSAIEVKEVAGQKLTFVTMRREEDGAVVMVPQTKVISIGVRKVAGPEDVTQVFEFLRSDSDKADLDWKMRARTNQDRMAQGGLIGMAEVVKGLQVLSELRPLPTKERELYDNARHLLVSEIAAALNTSDCNAEDSIDLVLFPPGRERPKRTAAEFAPRPGEGDEELGLDADLLGLDSELDLPPDEEEAPAEEEETSEEAGEEEERGGRGQAPQEGRGHARRGWCRGRAQEAWPSAQGQARGGCRGRRAQEAWPSAQAQAGGCRGSSAQEARPPAQGQARGGRRGPSAQEARPPAQGQGSRDRGGRVRMPTSMTTSRPMSDTRLPR